AEYDICSFSSDAGKGDQFFKRVWNFAAEALDEGAGTSLDVGGLCIVVAGRPNDLFDFVNVGVCERLGIGEALEQLWCDAVYVGVGRLRGKDYGNQQLKVALKIQFAISVGISLPEEFHHLLCCRLVD